MNVPLLDLRVLYQRQKAEIDAAVAGVLASQAFILGAEVGAFEQEVLAFVGAHDAHAVGVANGSDAIVLALRGMGIAQGDEVICPAYSFTSTATSISLVGATPVFADVELPGCNVEPDAVLAQVGPKTKAIIAVHLYGRAADVAALREGLKAMGRADVPIIEDAAQALGAALDGVPVGRLGDVMTTSFFPSKNLGCFGDGGLVLCHDEALGQRVRMLRAHGAKEKYKAEYVGQNSRLDALQAAVLRVKLPALRGWCEERAANAEYYRERFAALALDDALTLPPGSDGGRYLCIYNQFNVLARDRDALRAALGEAGIGSAVYYPRTLPMQPCYAELGYAPTDHPNATYAASRSLAIPVYPGVTRAQLDHVVETIARFYGA